MKVITLGKYGALGNNFFRFIHLVAYCKDHNLTLHYSDRRNIDKYFRVDENVIYNKKTPWILSSDLLRSILRGIDKSPRLVKLLNLVNVYLHDHLNHNQRDIQASLSRAKKNAVLLVLRDFRVPASLAGQISCFRDALDLKPELTKKIELEYQELKRKFKVLIGVHVRRGDYKEWREGKYYFSDAVFAKKINEFISHKKLNVHEVGVILCSNGTPLIENFPGLNVHYESRPEEEDLFLMQRCDYIIGPPSTFCSMSSFMGSVPLYFIEDDETTDFEERLHICSY